MCPPFLEYPSPQVDSGWFLRPMYQRVVPCRLIKLIQFNVFFDRNERNIYCINEEMESLNWLPNSFKRIQFCSNARLKRFGLIFFLSFSPSPPLSLSLSTKRKFCMNGIRDILHWLPSCFKGSNCAPTTGLRPRVNFRPPICFPTCPRWGPGVLVPKTIKKATKQFGALEVHF